MQLFSVVLSGVIATLTLGALPVFVARLSETLALSLQQSGVLAAADLGGCTIGCVIALFIQRKMNWRRILVSAIAISASGSALSLFSTEFLSLIISRGVAGVGNGLIVALVFSALYASTNPDRNFGFYTFGQLITQALSISSFTYLVQIFDIGVIFIVLTCLSISLLALTPFFPVSRKDVENGTSIEEHTAISIGAAPGASPLSAGAVISLIGLSIYFLGFAAIWAFLDPIGQNAELSVTEVGKTLGMASLIGILGPLAVMMTQPFFHRMVLLVIGTLLHTVSLIFLVQAGAVWGFMIGASLFIFSLNFVFPFQMGALSGFDKDGSIAVVSLILQLGCLSLGPVLGGIVYAKSGPSILLVGVMVAFMTSIVLFLLGARRLNPA
ncbi:MAG: MFS transporter [Pseudomonadota bacterium]